MKIGRSLEADISIDDPSLSRLHAVIRVDSPTSVLIEDLGSVNGTKLRGTRLEPRKPTPVTPGDLIEAGRSKLHVSDEAERPSIVPRAIKARIPVPSLVIENAAMRAVHDLVLRVAESEITVLILGETGVGKEVLAREVHAHSKRRHGPYVPMNCGAFTQDLLESELFGHEKGSFTGALKTKPGLLEIAAGGTVFLDEIGEMPLPTQVKLLRVLEERKVRRVGGLDAIPLDVRFVAATNRDLAKVVDAGKFREDLFYRLNGVTVTVPPLRERRDEIPHLVEAFASAAFEREGLTGAPEVSALALAQLTRHAWPGNIRELRNVIERAVVLSRGDEIDLEHLPKELFEPRASTVVDAERRAPDSRSATEVREEDDSDESSTLKEEIGALERERILKALESCGGNQTRAAQLLGLSRQSLIRRLGQYDVPRPRKR